MGVQIMERRVAVRKRDGLQSSTIHDVKPGVYLGIHKDTDPGAGKKRPIRASLMEAGNMPQKINSRGGARSRGRRLEVCGSIVRDVLQLLGKLSDLEPGSGV
jgi:hypothetical protein